MRRKINQVRHKVAMSEPKHEEISSKDIRGDVGGYVRSRDGPVSAQLIPFQASKVESVYIYSE